jgi:hypothetical protein
MIAHRHPAVQGDHQDIQGESHTHQPEADIPKVGQDECQQHGV